MIEMPLLLPLLSNVFIIIIIIIIIFIIIIIVRRRRGSHSNSVTSFTEDVAIFFCKREI